MATGARAASRRLRQRRGGDHGGQTGGRAALVIDSANEARCSQHRRFTLSAAWRGAPSTDASR
eukprot:13308429-Heterocapsa_arctica.AAC.1